MLELASTNNVNLEKFPSLLKRLAKKLFSSTVGIAIGGFVLWLAGFPQDLFFLLYMFTSLLFFDVMSWGIDRFSQYWRYRHSKSIASALTPFISIVAFWAVFCRCPIEVILSGDHWQVLALLLLYPTYKMLHVFWEIFRSKDTPFPV